MVLEKRMRVAIGADHRGFDYKAQIKQLLNEIEWLDVGANNEERSDYPIFAKEVALAVQNKRVHAGILLCGSGIGMAIAANRCAGIYAGLVWNEEVARLAKEHDNVNVLVLPTDFIDINQAVLAINAWREATFLGGEYAQRIAMINRL